MEIECSRIHSIASILKGTIWFAVQNAGAGKAKPFRTESGEAPRLSATRGSGLKRLLTLQRQSQQRFAATPISAVLENKRAAVRFRNLSRQHQADARAACLRGKERHKQV